MRLKASYEALFLIVTFLALDLNHITDFGTTWQTCHGYSPASDQFR